MTTEQKHTPGPLQVGNFDSTRIYDSHPDGPIMVASVARKGIVEDEREANAARLFACWNACEGMEDPIAEVVSLRVELDEAKAHAVEAWEDCDRLRATNAELLAALKVVSVNANGKRETGYSDVPWATIDNARAAIAKAEAQS